MMCPFCKRGCPVLTAHHLIPKSLGGKVTIKICRDCHRACHTVFSNKELRDAYHTKTALLSNEKFRKMIKYISKQDSGGRVKFGARKQR